MNNAWGKDITILVWSDFKYLPAVYALFNSSIENGFVGSFIVITNDRRVIKSIFRHDNIKVIFFEIFGGHYIPNVARLRVFDYLTEGQYLFLDADIIFERPCGFIFECITEYLLVSTENEQKYDQNDLLVARQARAMNKETKFRFFEYINCGLVGFSLPRDFKILHEWKDYSHILLKNKTKYAEDTDWFFLEQDIWNILVRTSNHPVVSISSRLLEINSSPKHFSNRKFPHSEQFNLAPKDQLKYIIHGAGGKRPWALKKNDTLRKKVINFLYNKGIMSLIRKPTTYERAWAYYSCRENLFIPVSFWARDLGFKAYKNIFWRKSHGL